MLKTIAYAVRDEFVLAKTLDRSYHHLMNALFRYLTKGRKS